jgi:glucosamine 6-phosphate synthetase-like amidotransferase/phosphosugar isomerase protein
MCGVFGFAARKRDQVVSIKALEKIAAVTETRGPHAFGFAWIDSKGRLRCFKSEGRITNHLGVLAIAKDARMLIGHCRYATQGPPSENINNHPHPVDGGWFVHNGVIRNYWLRMQKYDLFPVSNCDSELIGLMFERQEGTNLQRLCEAIALVGNKPLVVLGLWKNPDQLIAVRDGNPLHLGVTSKGTYFGSLAADLPGEVKEFKDGEAQRFALA